MITSIFNIFTLPILFLSLIGVFIVLSNIKRYGKISILLIVLMLNTFIYSLIESIIINHFNSFESLYYIPLLGINAVSIMLKIFILLNGKNKEKDSFGLVSSITRCDLICYFGILYIVFFSIIKSRMA